MIVGVYGALTLHILLFFLLFLLFCWQGYQCWSLYRRGETSLQIRIKQAGTTRFPAISIQPGLDNRVMGRLHRINTSVALIQYELPTPTENLGFCFTKGWRFPHPPNWGRLHFLDCLHFWGYLHFVVSISIYLMSRPNFLFTASKFNLKHLRKIWAWHCSAKLKSLSVALFIFYAWIVIEHSMIRPNNGRC